MRWFTPLSAVVISLYPLIAFAAPYATPELSEEELFFRSLSLIGFFSVTSLLLYRFTLHRTEKSLDVALVFLGIFSLITGLWRFLQWLRWNDGVFGIGDILLGPLGVPIWLVLIISAEATLFKWLAIHKPWKLSALLNISLLLLCIALTALVENWS